MWRTIPFWARIKSWMLGLALSLEVFWSCPHSSQLTFWFCPNIETVLWPYWVIYNIRAFCKIGLVRILFLSIYFVFCNWYVFKTNGRICSFEKKKEYFVPCFGLNRVFLCVISLTGFLGFSFTNSRHWNVICLARCIFQLHKSWYNLQLLGNDCLRNVFVL